MFLATVVLFGPLHGFHHMVVCGILGCLFLNGEDPDPNGFIVSGYEVTVSPWRFGISVVLWLACLVCLAFGVYSRRPGPRRVS
jgi:hypothetical protein